MMAIELIKYLQAILCHEDDARIYKEAASFFSMRVPPELSLEKKATETASDATECANIFGYQ